MAVVTVNTLRTRVRPSLRGTLQHYTPELEISISVQYHWKIGPSSRRLIKRSRV